MLWTSNVSSRRSDTGTIARARRVGTICLIRLRWSGYVTLNGTLTSTLADGSGVGSRPSRAPTSRSSRSPSAPTACRVAYTLDRSADRRRSRPCRRCRLHRCQFDQLRARSSRRCPDSRRTSPPDNMGSQLVFGGGVSMTTAPPLAVAAGELCPNTGQTQRHRQRQRHGDGDLQDGQVTVTPRAACRRSTRAASSDADADVIVPA